MNQDVQDALCFVLWHHQGGSSTIGQPIRKMFGLGPHESMDKNELEGAKRVQQALSVKPQRKPLTDEQIAHATAQVFMGGNPSLTGIARAIEAAHNIGVEK